MSHENSIFFFLYSIKKFPHKVLLVSVKLLFDQCTAGRNVIFKFWLILISHGGHFPGIQYFLLDSLLFLGIGFLFSALPSLITLYVVENTTTQDYGASFAAATLVFGLAQAVSPPIGGWIADVGGSFFMVFVLSSQPKVFNQNDLCATCVL